MGDKFYSQKEIESWKKEIVPSWFSFCFIYEDGNQVLRRPLSPYRIEGFSKMAEQIEVINGRLRDLEYPNELRIPREYGDFDFSFIKNKEANCFTYTFLINHNDKNEAYNICLSKSYELNKYFSNRGRVESRELVANYKVEFPNSYSSLVNFFDNIRNKYYDIEGVIYEEDINLMLSD